MSNFFNEVILKIKASQALSFSYEGTKIGENLN